MRASVDTNVFVALFSGDEEATPWAQRALVEVAGRASLAVSPVAYAELLAGGRSPEILSRFLADKGVEVDWALGEEAWREAGTRFGAYSRDRSKQVEGPGPRRILADFLVGAHALEHGGGVLLTLDQKVFSRYFPELRVISPPEYG